MGEPTPSGVSMGRAEWATLSFMAEAYRAIQKHASTSQKPARKIAAKPDAIEAVRRMIGAAGKAPNEAQALALYELVERGVPGTATRILATEYGVSLKTVAEWLDTSTKTIARHGTNGMLGRAESDIALRYGRVFEQAREAFGSEEAARDWLNSPQPSLGGAVPTELLRTELGARHVERVLELIDYGDYL